MKYGQRTNLMRRPNFLSFDTPEDGVFLRCMDSDCFVLEGGNWRMFDRLTVEMGVAGRACCAGEPKRLACRSNCVSRCDRVSIAGAGRTGFQPVAFAGRTAKCGPTELKPVYFSRTLELQPAGD